MNTAARLVQMILRGNADKFKRVLQEELEYRASIILEKLYKQENLNILENSINCDNLTDNPGKSEITEEINTEFTPQSTYQLKDGNLAILTKEEQELIFKLHKNLNKDNKERMEKLITESQESFNRILKMAKKLT